MSRSVVNVARLLNLEKWSFHAPSFVHSCLLTFVSRLLARVTTCSKLYSRGAASLCAATGAYKIFTKYVNERLRWLNPELVPFCDIYIYIHIHGFICATFSSSNARSNLPNRTGNDPIGLIAGRARFATAIADCASRSQNFIMKEIPAVPARCA